jgi:vacuolar-type H+-ATPase subunit F/Vma7
MMSDISKEEQLLNIQIEIAKKQYETSVIKKHIAERIEEELSDAIRNSQYKMISALVGNLK